jgi:predicted alpha/beta-fold hydrolase
MADIEWKANKLVNNVLNQTVEVFVDFVFSFLCLLFFRHLTTVVTDLIHFSTAMLVKKQQQILVSSSAFTFLFHFASKAPASTAISIVIPA